jgi:hypothetical protein
MNMEINNNDSLPINPARQSSTTPALTQANVLVPTQNSDSFTQAVTPPRVPPAPSPFTLPPGTPPIQPPAENEANNFVELLSQQTAQVQQQALQQLGILRQQLTNPLFMLSHGGVGNLLSMMFGNDKRMMNANRIRTDEEDRIAEEVYFSLIEAERVFPTKRVSKPDGTVMQ